MKKIATVLSLFAVVMGLSACNTIQGLGKDVQQGGQAVQKVAQ